MGQQDEFDVGVRISALTSYGFRLNRVRASTLSVRARFELVDIVEKTGRFE